MAIEKVRDYLKQFGADSRIIKLNESSATVELAARALGVEEARIAKTLSFKEGDRCILVVCAGDVKIDNPKFKATFGMKAKMLSGDEVNELVGHAIGGVCPFAVKESAKVYLDESLKRFTTVFPACGSSNSAIELTVDELEKLSKALGWVDVCKMVNI